MFHLPSGEMTVTLEDVAMITALPIDGHAVTGSTSSPGWRQRCVQLLGAAPDLPMPLVRPSKTAGIPLSWIRLNFSNCPPDADDQTVQRHARAYCINLFGSVLFPG